MTDLFISVLNLTLAGSAAAVIVLVLRLLLRRVPGIYSYFLWIFVFFRFLSPFSVETAISLFPVSRQAVEPSPVYELIPSVHTGISAVDETANAALVSAAGANPAGSVSPVRTYRYGKGTGNVCRSSPDMDGGSSSDWGGTALASDPVSAECADRGAYGRRRKGAAVRVGAGAGGSGNSAAGSGAALRDP